MDKKKIFQNFHHVVLNEILNYVLLHNYNYNVGIEMVFHQCEYEYDLLSELFVSKSLDNMDIQDLLDKSAINMTK